MLNKIKDNLGGNLKCAFTGGAKLEFEVQQFFGDIGIPIIEGYGLTETSPIIVTEKYGPTEFTQGGLQEAPGVQVRSIFFIFLFFQTSHSKTYPITGIHLRAELLQSVASRDGR